MPWARCALLGDCRADSRIQWKLSKYLTKAPSYPLLLCQQQNPMDTVKIFNCSQKYQVIHHKNGFKPLLTVPQSNASKFSYAVCICIYGFMDVWTNRNIGVWVYRYMGAWMYYRNRIMNPYFLKGCMDSYLCF